MLIRGNRMYRRRFQWDGDGLLWISRKLIIATGRHAYGWR